MATRKSKEKRVKISSKQIYNIGKSDELGAKVFVYGDGDSKLEFEVYGAIPLEKKISMTSYILAIAFSGSRNSLDGYSPLIVEFAKGCGVLEYYTNLEVPSKFEDVYFLLKHTPVYSDILEFIKNDADDVLRSIDDIVAARRDYYTHRSDAAGGFEKLLSIADTFKDKLSGVDIEKLLNGLRSLSGATTKDIVDSILAEEKGQTK